MRSQNASPRAHGCALITQLTWRSAAPLTAATAATAASAAALTAAALTAQLVASTTASKAVKRLDKARPLPRHTARTSRPSSVTPLPPAARRRQTLCKRLKLAPASAAPPVATCNVAACITAL